MSRDKFDDILARKLASQQIEPPAGLWSKIEKELAQSPATLAQTPQAETLAQQPKVRLNSRRNKLWQLSAAASIAVVAGIIALQYVVRDSIMNEAKIAVRENLISEPIREEVQPRELIKIIEQLPQTIAQNIKRSKTTIATPILSASQPDNVTPAIEITETATQTDTATQTKASPTNGEQQTQSSPQGQAKSAVQPKKQIVNWDELLRQETNKKRSKRALSTSLFASNYGGGIKGTNVVGAARLATSELKIQEIININNNNNIVTSFNNAVTQELRHKMPLSFGVSVSMGINKRISIETGLTYSMLNSESKAKGISKYKLEQELHYVGIPVAALYNIVGGNRANLYARAGGAVEKCVSGVRDIETMGDNNMVSNEHTKMKVSGVQISVGAALGGELKLSKSIGIYVEPGVGYYFENNSQPESYRTENPVNFTLKAGLRFKIK